MHHRQWVQKALTGLAHDFCSPQEIRAKAGRDFALPVQRVSCAKGLLAKLVTVVPL